MRSTCVFAWELFAVLPQGDAHQNETGPVRRRLCFRMCHRRAYHQYRTGKGLCSVQRAGRFRATNKLRPHFCIRCVDMMLRTGIELFTPASTVRLSGRHFKQQGQTR